jgi:teichoic acid transport system ATP-binding protein
MNEPIAPAATPAQLSMSLSDVEVTYRVYADRRPQLKDLFRSGMRNRDFREINAVQGVSFQANVGEAVGLIGRNGSGKSTLLSAMAGLLPIDSGEILARSQPTLLGVGAALNAKVSGRRNIELGLLALGIPKAEVQQHISPIIEFSGLGEYVDLPLTAYSSGMKARLHFSVATAVQPDILLIDEALAVGDRGFKRKSERRIQDMLENAGTIFIVSHSEQAIRNMCRRAVWLDRGRIQMDGDVDEVLDAYEASVEEDNGERTGTTVGRSKRNPVTPEPVTPEPVTPEDEAGS